MQSGKLNTRRRHENIIGKFKFSITNHDVMSSKSSNMIKPIKLVVVYNPKSKRENRKALQDQPQGEEDFAGLTVLPESGRLSKKTHTSYSYSG